MLHRLEVPSSYLSRINIVVVSCFKSDACQQDQEQDRVINDLGDEISVGVVAAVIVGYQRAEDDGHEREHVGRIEVHKQLDARDVHAPKVHEQLPSRQPRLRALGVRPVHRQPCLELLERERQLRGLAAARAAGHPGHHVPAPRRHDDGLLGRVATHCAANE